MDDAWHSLTDEPRALGRPISDEEWLELDDDERCELVDGRLEEPEMPTSVHELAISWLIRTLGNWLGSEGFIFASGIKLILRSGSGRIPDAVVVLPGSPAPGAESPIRVPPDILIEVVTPTPRDQRRDRVQKMTEYARYGARYYWLVDPALRSVEIFELTDGRYARAAAAISGKLDPVPGCTGFVLDVDALWAELRRLAPQ